MYLRLSPYQEILQAILTDLEVNEGIIKITGKSDAGKTALCIELFQELQDKAQPAVLFLKPPANATDLQQEILAKLNLDSSGNFTRTLTTYLVGLANPKPLVLIFDDAHELDLQTFSAIRMLCNIQNQSRALIRIIICGNEELDTRLATPALRAVTQFLSQSLTVPYLTREQVHDFCEAYWQSQSVDMKPLSEKAQRKLFQETQGRPGILQARLNQGTAGAEKTDHSKGEATAGGEPRRPAKYAGARPGWLPSLLVILALMMLAGIGAWFYFMSTVPTNATATAVEVAAENTVETPVEAAEPSEPDVAETIVTDGTDATPAVAAATVEPAPAAPDAVPAPQSIQQESVAESSATSVEAFLASWVESWQNGDVERYLAAYHESFAPPQGLTRSAWEEQRRRAIGSAQDLVITADPPESNTEAQNGMRLVRFWLNYSAANYADRTLKEVLLVPVDGTWRIRAENNLRTARL